MPEENVNTMSENDEKQKAGSRLDAMSMHKSDVEALTNKINDLAPIKTFCVIYGFLMCAFFYTFFFSGPGYVPVV